MLVQMASIFFFLRGGCFASSCLEWGYVSLSETVWEYTPVHQTPSLSLSLQSMFSGRTNEALHFFIQSSWLSRTHEYSVDNPLKIRWCCGEYVPNGGSLFRESCRLFICGVTSGARNIGPYCFFSLSLIWLSSVFLTSSVIGGPLVLKVLDLSFSSCLFFPYH